MLKYPDGKWRAHQLPESDDERYSRAVDSGEKRVSEWRTFVFNLNEAYKKTFGGNPPSEPEGIAILSDANSGVMKILKDE